MVEGMNCVMILSFHLHRNLVNESKKWSGYIVFYLASLGI